MPTTNDQPHANGGNSDAYVIIDSSNGAGVKVDSADSGNVCDSDAETKLVMRYIGEDYKEEKESNYGVISQFVKILDEYLRDNTDEDTYKKIKSAKPSENAEVQVQSSTEDTWEKLDVVTTVTDSDISELMKRASTSHYQAILSDQIDQYIHLMCATLFKKDYKCETMSNDGGALCWNYPANIFIPIGVKMNDPNSSNEDKYDPKSEVPDFFENFKTYCNAASSAAVARCRSRFPVPVILFNGKFICRSGTLAVRKGAAFEAFRRASGQKTLLNTGYEIIDLIGKTYGWLKRIVDSATILTRGVEEIKEVDVKILKMLKIECICDLMVEDRKIHTGMSVSSSEKVNVAKYGSFRCLTVPYPGCEFFRKYHEIRSDKDYEKLKKKLIYEWNAPEVSSTLGIVSEEEYLPWQTDIKWEEFKTWDLEILTRIYFQLMLHYLQAGEGGLLVHCISGWDRTPLFICLLRVSLWADDLIHRELDVNQMAYFTLGYDWYLFGHDLPNRLRKKEEIMHFCFKFIPCIAYYSINSENINLHCRKERLEALSKKLLHFYDECVPDEYFKELENPEKHVDPQPVE